MRFFMVDRITAIEEGARITGVKNVSIVEDFFNDFRSALPTLSPPVLIESLAQLGVWFLASASDFQSRAVLLSLGEVRFHAEVGPGDQLALENWVEAQSAEAALISGCIKVDGTVVMEMTGCMCAIVPTGDLEDPDHTRRMFRLLTADLEKRAGSTGQRPVQSVPSKVA
jgi:3-hydroxyacyl-[acyl-carrier-protein] dehydratase